MTRPHWITSSGVFLLLMIAVCAGFGSFTPGKETLVMAHNAFTEKGQWTDRFDRALSSGLPLAIEIDLTWGPNPKTGKTGSLVGDFPERRFNEITGDEPQLKPYFFESMRPTMEKALKDNDKRNWPLIRLYLDIKNDPPEHLETISNLLHEYESWMTTAIKTKDAAQQSLLDLKPMMVMVEDKDNDIKEEYFYNRVPVGGKVLAFGTIKLPMPRGEGLTARQISDLRFAMKPEELITQHATNWRRWWSCSWNFVEAGAKSSAGDWSAEKEARLNALVKQAHIMGYLVSFWNLKDRRRVAHQLHQLDVERQSDYIRIQPGIGFRCQLGQQKLSTESGR
jgi:hypothetical protein